MENYLQHMLTICDKITMFGIFCGLIHTIYKRPAASSVKTISAHVFPLVDKWFKFPQVGMSNMWQFIFEIWLTPLKRWDIVIGRAAHWNELESTE